MRYQVNDEVVHIQHGLGRVVGLVNNSFANAESSLYYEISFGKSTAWVLVESAPSNELRALTRKRDLAQYRAILSSKPVALSRDHRQRRIDLVKFSKAGTFENLCIIVRDLTAQSQLKPLNDLDSMTLRQAHTNLTREWAAVEEISLVDAIRHIGALILEGRLALGEGLSAGSVA